MENTTIQAKTVNINVNLKYLAIELVNTLFKVKQDFCRPCCYSNHINNIIGTLQITDCYTSAIKAIENYERLKKDCSKCRDYNKINDVMNELKQAVNYKEPVKRYR